ncbi:MAG: hypothetical protein GXP39_08025 [Chloroflexi bacterium]|nr:hypothetical protein [Chloroflexota bacterium]
MDWFRFYNETYRDPKIRRLSREMGCSIAEAVGVWAILLSLASESERRGALMLNSDIPLDLSDLEDATGAANIKEWLECMQRLGMLTYEDDIWYITNWDKRQFASDSSTERVKRYRERKREAERNGDETLQQRSCNVSGTPPDTDTETDTDSDTEKDLTAPAAPSQSPRQRKSPRSGKKRSAKTTTDPGYQPIFEALCKTCVLDPKLNAPKIGRFAKRLRQAGYGANHVADFEAWWYANDWRGQKGQPPTLEQVASMLPQALQPRASPASEPKGFAAIREYMRKRGLTNGDGAGDAEGDGVIDLGLSEFRAEA